MELRSVRNIHRLSEIICRWSDRWSVLQSRSQLSFLVDGHETNSTRYSSSTKGSAAVPVLSCYKRYVCGTLRSKEHTFDVTRRNGQYTVHMCRFPSIYDVRCTIYDIRHTIYIYDVYVSYTMHASRSAARVYVIDCPSLVFLT